MARPAIWRRPWLLPTCMGIVGIGLSLLAFEVSERAEERRVHGLLDLRSEWRVRDIEAKVRRAGGAVENVAIALTANAPLDPERFHRLAQRVRHGLVHVNSIQWAPRVRRDEVAAFERSAQDMGLKDYRLFEVGPDFQRTALSERDEYFPVLFEVRFQGHRRAQGLSLGKFDGRRIPMEQARRTGEPVATMPVRPIGPRAQTLVFLLFWPVYEGIGMPRTEEDRWAELRGYALGNYDIATLLTEAMRDTPNFTETIRFRIAASHGADTDAEPTVIYSPASQSAELPDNAVLPAVAPAVSIARHFDVFGQHWDLTIDYPETVVDDMRSQAPYGWLLAGLLLSASVSMFVYRERSRAATIQALVAERTAALERTSAQLHQAQKMEAIGNLTGGLAHDFNNLLSVIIGNLDLLIERSQKDPESATLAKAALAAGMRGAELNRRLLAFARRQPLQPQLTDVNELVSGMTALLARILEEHIQVTLVTAPDLWKAMVDPAQLSAVVANLATNARDAMPKGGTLTIETRNIHLDADYVTLNPEATVGDYILIEMTDSGTGIAPEVLPHVFEPFFTTKPAGRGTGLGLSMVFGFVRQSHGHIKVYSEVGRGSTFRVYLPRAAAPTVMPEEPPPAAAPAGGRQRRILVVEDNADVRAIVTRQLRSLGHVVVEAEHADAALAVLRDPGASFDLLFTDVVMPGGMDGHGLAKAARALRPSLLVLLSSGYPGSAMSNGSVLGAGQYFLGKPYRRNQLAEKLNAIFGS
jgi:signal transduction histidine kinase